MDKDIKEKIEVLWWQLVQLNSSLFVLEKIISFPWDLFFPKLSFPFWELILKNFYDMCVLILFRITENNSKKLSLYHIIEEIEYPELKKYLEEVEEVNKEVLMIRHNEIAHLQTKWMTNRKARQKYLLSIGKLKKLTENLNMAFNEICKLFNQGRELVLWKLEDEIEEIIDSIVKQSPLIKMPEEQPEYWKVYRKELRTDDLDIFNRYRRKFGLPPV